MIDSTIWENFTLPSKGLVYDRPINPHISLRSMNIMDDMKRQSKSEQQYKTMADMIEGCCKEKPDLHIYDLCMGDYTFLLHRLRMVTLGADYGLQCVCPSCHQIVKANFNLEDIDINEYNEEIESLKLITLPVSNKNIELKFITPKDNDIINYRNRERQNKVDADVDFSELYMCMALIKKVDGKVLNSIQLEEFVKSLLLKDIHYLLVNGTKLNSSIGVNSQVKTTCKRCGGAIITSFRLTTEFFGPTYE